MRKYNKIFIEHTPYCRLNKCDTPCEGQEMPICDKMNPEKISEILSLLAKNIKMFDSDIKIILYGQGSSNYPYDLIEFPNDEINIETTICEDYQEHYDKLKNTPIKSFARVYSLTDIKEAMKYDYDGYYFVVNGHSYSDYKEMMEMGNDKIMPIPLNEATDYIVYDKLVEEFKLNELDRVKHHKDKIMVITDLVEKYGRQTLLRRLKFNPSESTPFFLNYRR